MIMNQEEGVCCPKLDNTLAKMARQLNEALVAQLDGLHLRFVTRQVSSNPAGFAYKEMMN